MDRDVHVGKNIQEYSLFDNPYLIPFRRSDFKRSQFFSSSIDQKQFINAINLKNFVDGQIFAYMIYPHTKEEVLLKVSPGPCMGSEVTLSLPEGSVHNFKDFMIKALLVDNGKSVIMMQADSVLVTNRVLTIRLRKAGMIYHDRHAKRYKSSNINARISHHDIEYAGILYEFSPDGLRIELKGIPWVESSMPTDTKESINVELMYNGHLVFAGFSRLVRTENNGKTIVLAPTNMPQKRYSERKNRNPRLNLVPSPEVKFIHPLTRLRVSYDILDINSSGFSVLMESDSSLLMPGMIIDEAIIEFAGGLNLKCPVQVIYGEKKKKNIIKYGFLISDIDVESYNQLFNVVSRADDPYARVSYDVDMASLWNFFFESGFIYPEKYTSIAQSKDDFKQIYKKLYHECPDIFANLTYERNGVIYGHVSLIKAYERSWLVNQLATKDAGLKVTGMHILNQILNYFDSITRMPTVGMDYLIMSFAPDNRFPNSFFSGAHKAVNNPSQLSMDMFACMILEFPQAFTGLPVNWSLRECTPKDTNELKAAYKELSDGIFVNALCLDARKSNEESIEDTYKKYGLKRICKSFVLIHENKSLAYLVADQSEKGINLSDMINSVKVIVPKNSTVPWYVLCAAIFEINKDSNVNTVNAQIFPCEYLDRAGIHYKKKHAMWVLETRYLQANIDVIKGMVRFNPTDYIRGVLSSFIRSRTEA